MELQHDPKTKQQIKNILYDFLYQPVQKSYKAKLKGIIGKNCQLQGTSHPCFIFRGITYPSDGSTTFPRRLPRLHDTLVPDMEAYLQELKYLNETELPYVIGFINKVLNSTNDLHDYLRILPSSVHQPIKTLIDTCGCRVARMPNEQVQILQETNAVPIELMKKRLMLNLLI